MSGRSYEGVRLFTREQCETLTRQALRLVSLPHARVSFESAVTGTVDFSRGDTHASTENVAHAVSVNVMAADGRMGIAATSDFTNEGLSAAVADAEELVRQSKPDESLKAVIASIPRPVTPAPSPNTYFEEVFTAMAPEGRAAIVRHALDSAGAANLIGAGTIRYELVASSAANTNGFFHYDRRTYGEFSLTARTKDGTGSGWAWGGYEDWSRVPIPDIVARAVSLGTRSANPVAVEPGRYTVILEPAAVADLVGEMANPDVLMMRYADEGLTVYSKEPLGTNKIGLRMIDARLDLVADPWDPELPATTFSGIGIPIERVAWIERGILKHLSADPAYAASRGQPFVVPTDGVRLQPNMPTETLEEMIASTPRGIWVNRFTSVAGVNQKALLLTGVTRDGTFLIENGKVTKPIKNLRFNESPFFVLNKLEAAGVPVRASRRVVAPRLKVRDFDFTSLTDAV